MITYAIIEELKENGVMYKTKGIELNSLWVADDVTLISNSVENTKTNIELLKKTASKYGLKINIKKK